MFRAQAALETREIVPQDPWIGLRIHREPVPVVANREAPLFHFEYQSNLAALEQFAVDSLAKLTVDSYGGVLAAVVLTPAMIGEVGLALWLTIRGVRRAA